MSDQHCTELLSCSDRAYPGLSAANRVKKAAAAHLICHPDQCSSSSVAKAVHLVLGTSAKDLGLPSFRQLLSDDPCFIVHGAKESEAYIKLNKGQLVAAAERTTASTSILKNRAAAAHPHSNNQIKQQPAQRNPSQWKFFQGLLASVDIAFPSESAENRTKRIVATHLLNYPERNSMSAVAAAVRDAVGASSKALGLPPFKQLLSAEPSFIVDDTPGPEASIDINEDQLLKTASHNMRTAISSIYPATFRAADTRLRCAAALHLTDHPPLYRDKCTRVAAQLLGGNAKVGPSAKSLERFKQVMLVDPWFKITPSLTPSDVYLKLDAKQLMQWHLQQQAGASSSLSSSSAAAAATSTATSAAHTALPSPISPLPVAAAAAGGGLCLLQKATAAAAAASNSSQSPALVSSCSPLSSASSSISKFFAPPDTSRRTSSASTITVSSSESASVSAYGSLITSSACSASSSSSAWGIPHVATPTLSSWADVAAVQDVATQHVSGTLGESYTQAEPVTAPSAPPSTDHQSSTTPRAVFEAALQAFEAAALATMPPQRAEAHLVPAVTDATAGGVS